MNHMSCLGLLLEYDGATPLYTAAQTGHLEVVRFLVKSGANKDQHRTNNGATPLCAASENGHFSDFWLQLYLLFGFCCSILYLAESWSRDLEMKFTALLVELHDFAACRGG